MTSDNSPYKSVRTQKASPGFHQSRASYLKVVDGDKVREEGQDVLDLQQVALVQELHGPADVLLVLNHVAS